MNSGRYRIFDDSNSFETVQRSREDAIDNGEFCRQECPPFAAVVEEETFPVSRFGLFQFYADKDVESTDSLMFRITLYPFGEARSPLIDR